VPPGPGSDYRSPMASIRTLGCLAALAFPALVPAAASAAPPPNDDFDNAQELSGVPAEATGSNVDATREPGEPYHGTSNGEHSIWFKWRAPRDVGVTLRLEGCAHPFQNSNPGSAGASVYEQTVRFGLVPVGHTFRAVAGQTYFIAVGTPRGSQPDPDICVRLMPGPPNDDFASATPLTGFPASASHRLGSNEGLATLEPGEPTHAGGLRNTSPPPPPPPPPSGGSVWFSWTAPTDGPVRIRLCGSGVLGVYSGDRVDALTRQATRHTTDGRCGGFVGGSVTLRAIAGQVYRIAVASSSPSFRLFVENEVTLTVEDGMPFFLYTAFPGRNDDVTVRIAGAGPERALLLRAAGVAAANGCQASASPGWLHCPVPGRTAIGLDMDLRDGNDRADVRLMGREHPWGEESVEAPYRRVAGGSGNDTLTGSAGFYDLDYGWTDGLRLLGEAGADVLRGAGGYDFLRGGSGPDRLVGGWGSDDFDAGRGDDRLVGLDGASDQVDCGDGRDRARIDGFDLANRCERRSLGSPARATAVSASISNDDGEGVDHLAIGIACPIDAKRGCRARVTAPVGPRRTTTRRIRLTPGRSDWVEDYSLSDGAMNRLLRRGIRVTVTTRGRSGRKLRTTRHLPVSDDRYTGE
jgi:hypothetical protein